MAPSLRELAYQVYTRNDYTLSAVRQRRIYEHILAVHRYREAAEDFFNYGPRLNSNLTWRQMSRRTYHIMREKFDFESNHGKFMLRYLIDATRIRFTMQRFARALAIRIRRRRFRVRQYESVWRVLNEKLLRRETWRGLTRRIARSMIEHFGALRDHPTRPIRRLMMGTQQRFAMQRFVRGLKLLVLRERQRHLARSRDDPFDWRRLRRRLR